MWKIVLALVLLAGMAEGSTKFEDSDVKQKQQALRAEFENTLRTTSKLPLQVQKQIAREVLEVVVESRRELSRLTFPSVAGDALIKELGLLAKKRRHEALRNGAKDESDPKWAAAALSESWLFAITGVFGEEEARYTDSLLMGWISQVLPKKELEKLLGE